MPMTANPTTDPIRPASDVRIVDLSHPIEAGMTTYPGLPGPIVSAHLSRDASTAVYAEGTQFEIARIEMVGNTGTYLDAPWHRFADGQDLAGVDLAATVNLPTVVVDVRNSPARGVGVGDLKGSRVEGAAVLILTGWDRHWRTPTYGDPAPFLDREATAWLVEAGARLVGIDSVNIDDMADGTRPAHTGLLAAGIPVVEHLTNLAALVGLADVRFHAAPLPVRRFGTIAVRAYALVGRE